MKEGGKQQIALFTFSSWILIVCGAANLMVGTWSAVHGNVSIAGTCLTAGLLLLLAGNIDKFELLKGLGIEARTRRRLEETISEATDVLTQLRQLAELTGESLVTLQSTVGRFNGAPTPAYAYDTAQKVIATLKGVGCTMPSIRTALSSWVNTFLADMAAALYEPVRKKQDEMMAHLQAENAAAASAGDQTRSDEIWRQMNVISAHNVRSNQIREMVVSDPKEFQSFVLEAPVSADPNAAPFLKKIRDCIPEMQYLVKNLKLKKPEVWFEEIEAHRNRPRG